MPPVNQEFATKFTGMAFVLAKLFEAQFGRELVTGRTPKIQVPRGPSTEDGQQANQSIVLEKVGKPSITIGWANIATEQAEIRTYAYLEEMWRKRYPDQGFPLSKFAYLDFYEAVTKFLRDRNLNVQVKDLTKKTKVEAPVLVRRHAAGHAGLRKDRPALLFAVLIVLLGAAAILFMQFGLPDFL